MASQPVPLVFILLLLLLSLSENNHFSEAQQSYVNNKQLDCNTNYTTTLGFLCNGASTSCPSFLTFRSTPTYNTPASIAYLLSADAPQIAAANNISDIEPLPVDTLLIIPINCSCSDSPTHKYYQHNASYILKVQGETYFTVANITYQALTTCQAMIAQNPNNIRQLNRNDRLHVPLRCACPTRNQTAAGFNYLLTYLIRQGETYDSIARLFAGAGADVDGIPTANELSVQNQIFFFTPILVPLKIQPTKENMNAVSTPPPAQPPPLSPPALPPRGSGSHKSVFIGVGVGAAVLILFASILAVWFIYFRGRKSPTPPPKLAFANGSGEAAKTFPSWSISSEGIRRAIETLTVYKFEEVEKATESFSSSNQMEESSVYRATFKGDAAVVKIMKGDVSREIDALRQINHSRIVRLSGFCVHQGLTYLVYEYAENGPLTHWLRPTRKDPSPRQLRLDWRQRLQVAYDISDAINYLHNFTNPPYIHKNLTSANVLLDAAMRAKITNFGLARTLDSEDQAVMTRHVVGTYGYMAPEYIESGLITPKLDVYALGVVILELLSGREAMVIDDTGNGEGEQVALSQTIHQVLGGEGNVREKVHKFIDPWLGQDYPMELAYSAAQLAQSCVARGLDDRPTISDAFVALSKLLSLSLEWDPSHDTSGSFSN